ncbi:Heat shock 70 kDa protein 12A [Actinomortierella ambigua]|uniref:Heat shock 70 kDa protein 12A n=1 Tax=Actinomortierella ambigua TaxID=1343610 RepID=A0A9P6U4H0_9FUNG|nr:Heat shock 70 kDa protein 12A [Actinomortierella ambigua]
MKSWGYSLESAMIKPSELGFIKVEKFKPYLDENHTLKAWDHEPLTVEQAIADYLHAFHDCAAGIIEKKIGGICTREKFRYCLTVPAMWSDRAKYIMRKAVIQAGIISEDDHPDRLLLVSEPEAAALYCERKCKEYKIEEGKKFMICDAGGGTVDLIVYKVYGSGEDRTLSEVTKGHGATCGSIFIDLEFRELLISKFASLGVDIEEDAIPAIVDEFTYRAKHIFTGTNDVRIIFPWHSSFNSIENLHQIGIKNGSMILQAAELRSVFDPVVSSVLELIREQLDRANGCSAILLVGGFGSSGYLLNRVQQEFGHRVETITSPEKPGKAVVAGALYAALTPRKVTERVARRSYGVGVLSPFDPDYDPWSLMVWDIMSVRELPMCDDRFSVFVRDGKPVKLDASVTRVFNIVLEKGRVDTDYVVPIYGIQGEKPPRHVTGEPVIATIIIPSPFKSGDKAGMKVWEMSENQLFH